MLRVIWWRRGERVCVCCWQTAARVLSESETSLLIVYSGNNRLGCFLLKLYETNHNGMTRPKKTKQKQDISWQRWPIQFESVQFLLDHRLLLDTFTFFCTHLGFRGGMSAENSWSSNVISHVSSRKKAVRNLFTFQLEVRNTARACVCVRNYYRWRQRWRSMGDLEARRYNQNKQRRE